MSKNSVRSFDKFDLGDEWWVYVKPEQMEAAEIKIIAWMSEASIPQSEIDAILAAE